ncbi:MAG: hypothetical protein RBS80_04155 [Thermoguttaceae bacterium]|jgi:hypothetical protein|nr:hypothetical protein [Thermoguttaceae bacterium]
MKRAAAFWAIFTTLALAIAVFAPVLFADRTFGFRDGAHFYPPLWGLTAGEWSAGRVPLWNPYENLGQPLFAQPAAGVCYPGQLLFLLPLPLIWAQKLYIVGHVLLAAGAAYRLARSFRASATAAGVAAMAYAFSGSVLMQHTNAPFLVGAAWLPLAMLCADQLARIGTIPGERSLRLAAWWSVGLGVVLALMVLGGDPQMAYNVGLISALYVILALAAGGRGRVGGKKPGERRPSIRRSLGRFATAFRLFGAAALAALVLSAVQVLPAWQFAARSDRVSPSWRDRLTATLRPRSHHEYVYHFSVGPWRLAEFLWPNVAGRQYPVHHRWLDAIPAEGRIWTPTLYMGMLPLVLALAATRFRRGPLKQRWLSWLALLSTLAAFGYYGLGWLLAECHLDTGLGGPFGGLYWLMTLVLPGYMQFRYPAKLLVVTALAMSVLAARGWDRVLAGRGRRTMWLLFLLGTISIVGLLGAYAIRPFWEAWMAAVPADQLFGPLDASGAWRDLAAGFAQTALLCAVFGWLLHVQGKAVQGRAGRFFQTALPNVALLLVAADLAWSNAWLVATVPGAAAAAQSRFGRRIATALPGEPHSGSQVRPRIWRHPIWLPDAWRQSSSPDRLAEAMRFDRDTLWPNYNFELRIAVAEVHGTMMLRDYAEFLAARRTGGSKKRLTVLDLASHAVLPPGTTPPGQWQTVDRVPGAVMRRNNRPSPRAWIANPDSAGRPRNIDGESCRIVVYDPQRVELEATLREPGLVVLAEQYYPGWRLEVRRAGEGGRTVPIRRANGVMRAAELPAGEHHLTFRFRPQIVYLGAAISAAGWLALAGWIGWGFWKR